MRKRRFGLIFLLLATFGLASRSWSECPPMKGHPPDWCLPQKIQNPIFSGGFSGIAPGLGNSGALPSNGGSSLNGGEGNSPVSTILTGIGTWLSNNPPPATDNGAPQPAENDSPPGYAAQPANEVEPSSSGYADGPRQMVACSVNPPQDSCYVLFTSYPPPNSPCTCPQGPGLTR
jgi:hypothetical protein